MLKKIKAKLLVTVFGGAGTPVLSASAGAATETAQRLGCRIYGAWHGLQGILNEDFGDLTALDPSILEKLMRTTYAALGTLGEIKTAGLSAQSGRRIAVLGDMLELGIHTEKAHLDLGKHAAKVADYIVTVGARANFVAEGAIAAGFPESNIRRFETSEEVGEPLQELIDTGDLVLIKASQGIRTEKIVLEIMAEPQRAKELLVRQYGKWLKN